MAQPLNIVLVEPDVYKRQGILWGLILKNTLYKGNPVPFVMELPNYRVPLSLIHISTPKASVTMLPPTATQAPWAKGSRKAAAMGPEATPPESKAMAV